MNILSLEDIVRRYINLPSHASGTGWYPILCKVCNDSGKKGARAGFKFDNNKVCYHCFNCGHATVYDSDSQKNMPEKMQTVLKDFNVPEDEWKQVLLTGLANRDKGIISGSNPSLNSLQINIEPTAISLPEHFYLLADASPNDKWAQLASAYLEHERSVDPNSYPFMLARKQDNPELNHWFKRIIIPIFKDQDPIFYIGRDLSGKQQRKYLSPSYSKDKILYGFSELFRQTEEPLYIVEGWFDAFVINGVAILGNEISEVQSIWLNKSRRNKIYIPDRIGDGWVAGEKALKLGWQISTPDIANCKDINEAVTKYGRMFVMKSIADNTTSDRFTAEVKLAKYCSYDPTNKDRSKKKNKGSSPPKRTRS
jgi:hypothetical protein